MMHMSNGDILADEAEALVNTVNCVGIMGRGVALQFKKAFPANFRAYAAACKRQEIKPGKMFVVEVGGLAGPRFIINFPTKTHWKSKSKLDYIKAGLDALILELEKRKVASVAIPPLGCGLGGLAWSDVLPLIEHALGRLPTIDAHVYAPGAPPAAKDMVKAERPTMSPGRAALIGLMHRYVGGLMDPFITLLEVQKLMYFLQEAGQPLRLNYVKHVYGPYADNLRHVLNAVEGHYLNGYAEGGDDPDKELQLLAGAVEEADTFLRAHPETQALFSEVAKLVDGFETPSGMELLSSVHWVATRDGASSPAEATRMLHAWNERKRRFSADQVATAWTMLCRHGWLTPERCFA